MSGDDTQRIRERAQDSTRKAVESITQDMLQRHKMGYCWPGTEPMMAILTRAFATFALSERDAATKEATEQC